MLLRRGRRRVAGETSVKLPGETGKAMGAKVAWPGSFFGEVKVRSQSQNPASHTETPPTPVRTVSVAAKLHNPCPGWGRKTNKISEWR